MIDALVDATAFSIPSKQRVEVSEENAASPAILATCLADRMGLMINGTAGGIAVEVFDKDFEEWVLVTDLGQLGKGKMKLRLVNSRGAARGSATPAPPHPADTHASGTPFTGKEPLELTRSLYVEVPQYVINFGSDIKFEENPDEGVSSLRLHGLLLPSDYTAAIKLINISISKTRATSLDHALLFSGTAMLPLIPWALRKKARSKAFRKRIAEAVATFNSDHPSLEMLWLTKPSKRLIIRMRQTPLEGNISIVDTSGGGSTTAHTDGPLFGEGSGGLGARLSSSKGRTSAGASFPDTFPLRRPSD